MRLCAGAVLGAALTSGCASIWSRGIVLNEQRQILTHSSVSVTSVTGSETILNTPTDSFGCFLIARVAPKGDRNFRLEVGAPGYAPVTFDFRLETPILIVRLAKTGSDARSEIHPASPDETEDRWTPYSNPSLPGAQELAPGHGP